MSARDTDKFLKEMISFVNREYKRGALDKFPTIVTFTSEACGEGFKEGYNDVTAKDPSLPILSEEEFLQAGRAAVKAVTNWASQPQTRGTLVESSPDRVVYRATRDIKKVYTLAKKAGSDTIQKIWLSKGSRRLKGANKAEGISPRASEVGVLKAGIHRAHQGVTTVGSAQISGALRFLERTKGFADFATSKAASEIADLIEEINATFQTSGTKSGSQASTVSLKQDVEVAIDMLPRSKNPRGAEDYDISNLLPKLEKAVRAYIEKAKLATLPGSKSIEENAEDITTFILLKELSKASGAKVVGGIKKPKGRKPTNRTRKETLKAKKTKGSTKKAKTIRRRTASPASTPLRLMALINKELPKTVRNNMISPALVNRTGTFANSVKITDIAQTPKGFPSIGYTYAKNPYEVFELGSGNVRATPERDPRKIIDQSIREIAAQYALGRFYTRRV